MDWFWREKSTSETHGLLMFFNHQSHRGFLFPVDWTKWTKWTKWTNEAIQWRTVFLNCPLHPTTNENWEHWELTFCCLSMSSNRKDTQKMPSSDSMATYAEMPHSQRMPERLHGPSGPWIKGEKTWKDFVLKWVTQLPISAVIFYSQHDDSSMDFTLCSETAVAVSSKHVS